ncbi:ABC transporter permease [Lysinimonas soli]|uniref:ABC transporter permease n=1 Tax=Lysinimonas soli TaxID=1074233 RepID=A0ABW0NNT3_9MICO
MDVTAAGLPAAARITARGVRRRHWRPSRGVLLALRLGFIVLVLALWELGVDLGIIPRSAVAAPSQIALALGEVVPTTAFWTAIGLTLLTWGIGLGISVAVAVPLGIVFGIGTTAYLMFRNTIDFLRSIPPVALVPLALLLYGATINMAVALIVFGSVWPLLLQTMYGVHQIDPVARDVARSYRLTARSTFFSLILPSAAPFIATGFRISATISLLLGIGAQVIGGAPGIGVQLNVAEESNQIATVYAYILVAGALGMLINLGLQALERKVLKWHPSYR